MMRPLMIAACFALTTVASVASAQEAAQATPAPTATATAAIKGNADKGRQLTYTCEGCHGVTGYKNAYPNYHVPKIGGQSAEYLTSALTEYKKGARKHPTMQAQAQSFSDQDIADIAAFLSTLK
jgi:cytochrome c553